MTPRRAPVTTVAPAKITYTDHEGNWIEWSGVVGHLSNALFDSVLSQSNNLDCTFMCLFQAFLCSLVVIDVGKRISPPIF